MVVRQKNRNPIPKRTANRLCLRKRRFSLSRTSIRTKYRWLIRMRRFRRLSVSSVSYLKLIGCLRGSGNSIWTIRKNSRKCFWKPATKGTLLWSKEWSTAKANIPLIQKLHSRTKAKTEFIWRLWVEVIGMGKLFLFLSTVALILMGGP